MKTQAQPHASLSALQELGAKSLDALSAVAEANQRVLGQLVELSSTVAADRVRTLGELQSAAVEAARDAIAPAVSGDVLDELRRDPLSLYGKSLMAAVDGAQRVLKLWETNAQIVTRSAERFQGSAERTSKEIQETVSACATRLQDISGARS